MAESSDFTINFDSYVKTINSLPSRWVAAFSPVPVSFRRMDFQIDHVDYDAGTDEIIISVVNISGEVAASVDVGDQIYVSNILDEATQGKLYDAGVFEVTTVSTGGGYYNMHLKGTIGIFSLTTVDGYINVLKRDFTLEITVKTVAPFSFTAARFPKLINDKFVYSGAPDGEIIFDLRQVYKAFLKADVPIDWSTDEVVLDKNAVLNAYLSAIPKWTGYEQDDANNVNFQATLYGVHAVLQVQQNDYGNNLADYAIGNVDTPKFLTSFDVVPYYPGYPLTLSFLSIYWNEDDPVDVPTFFNNVDLKMRVYKSDGTDTTLTERLYAYDDNAQTLPQYELIHLVLNNIFDIPDDAVRMEVWLEELDSGDVLIGPMTEVKQIEVKSVCKNPVYLSWRNNLGGVSHWLFDRNQEKDTNFKDRTLQTLSMQVVNISRNVYDSLNEINATGVYTQRYITSLDNLKGTDDQMYQRLYIITDELKVTEVTNVLTKSVINTKDDLYLFELNVQLPEVFSKQ